MGCMKCGRDLEAGQTFCADCLAQMERYPVKPGTVVVLPRRDDTPVKRAGKRRIPPSAEQLVRKYRRRSRILAFFLALLLAAAGAAAYFTWHYVEGLDVMRPGQNYSPMETGETKEES